MPWSSEDFPAPMANLSPPGREKAIEIANALLAEGMYDGRAIRVASAKERGAQRVLPLHLDQQRRGPGCFRGLYAGFA